MAALGLARQRLRQFFADLFQQALHHARVAADDVAAGELIAREAGAITTDFAGGHNFYSSGNIVCGNPRVVKSLLEKIRDELPESLAR
jgi:fructose-1,6-bisphosphatase/inositol monophosphatase family enzyme